ncbi:hypothetical protein V491_07467 [Pseudogymnoascus sp. VKM F-3775]|nr:hypothetical protein V491_07467 [Pseudogymnoascus sp. VKM F-3775]
MPHQVRTPPPNTPKGSSEPVATSTMEMGSLQPLGRVAYPAHLDQGAPVLDQELEDESKDESDDECDDESDDEAEAGVASSEREVILSEAQSYLKQVKAQFVDQPDIYNTFIYILKCYKSQLNDPNAIYTTSHPVTRNELTPIIHINPPKMPLTPPNTPTELSEPVALSPIYETGGSTGMLSEQLGIRTKMDLSHLPGGVAYPVYIAPGALVLSQKQQEVARSYIDQVKVQFVD